MKKPKWTFEKICIQFSSVAQSCPTLCDPMDCSMPVLFVYHQLLEFTQTHVHGVGDAIQPSHPLSSPSPLAFNLSQHQGLFKWVSSSHQVAKGLEFQLQYQSFQWIFRTTFQMNLLDLLAVQGTLKSLLQHHSLKASILQCPAFFYSSTLTSTHDYWKKSAIEHLLKWLCEALYLHYAVKSSQQPYWRVAAIIIITTLQIRDLRFKEMQ